ncbi:ceruloplasmin-like [Trichosurus vulpecula]|uniref:ceruloplasmin-like n=1 Tax=Trichosurus vulpecula TaxID=9337 RepID=UPI00186ABFFE|nr:ceruloplasmin-like [Trichosurus vulpecula]
MTGLLLFTSFLIFANSPGWAKERHYYVGIREETWNYAPTGKNIVNGKLISEDKDLKSYIYLQRGAQRIGRVYKKAMYVQYTDGSYRRRVRKPTWLGFLGPILKGEVGDLLVVHMKNFASRRYTMHPHGATYTKENEGALYPDNTWGRQKEDDRVMPGQNYTYRWSITPEQGPGDGDHNCVTRIYHSHFDTVKDVASGLVGPLITCKKGTLNGDTEKDIDHSFVIMFSEVDENQSWYLEENIDTYCYEPDKVNKTDPAFVESNRMYSMNGFLFGNIPDITMCMEDRVHWHFFGMGSLRSKHAIFLHGQTLLYLGHRMDTFSIFAASMIDAVMVAKGAGEWMLSCQINKHLDAGMQAFFKINDCKKRSSDNVKGTRVRHYYIAAEEILWNYAPSGIDNFTRKSLTAPGSESAPYFIRGPDRIGGTYIKLQYKEYTDDSFLTKKTRLPEERHLGLLGPVIKTEVGDTVLVTFLNKANHSLSILPHCLRLTKSNEGSKYMTLSGGTPPPSSSIQPGENFTYEWTVPETVGPTSADPVCLTCLYFSAGDLVREVTSGMIGPLLVCRKGSLRADGRLKGVDKEFYLLPTIFDENESLYLDENIRKFTGNPNQVNKNDPDFQDSNRMASLNGYMFGNLPGLNMCLGDKISWHVLSVGTEEDMHGIYFSGNTFVSLGGRRDTINVIPQTSGTLFMTADSPGEFEVSCVTTDHYRTGLKHKYRVKQCDKPFNDNAHYNKNKVYYIAAVEVEWDYSPSRKWGRELSRLQGKNETNINIDKKYDWYLGSKYKKVVYIQFTDGSFKTPKPRTEENKHLDILGPMIQADVGNTVTVVFKNTASRSYSIHAHGVKTDYSIVTPTKPGETRSYKWKIPVRSGPTQNDSVCIPWVYYSSVNPVKDIYSGLVGTLLVCRRNVTTNHDVSRSLNLVLAFTIFDENESWYFDENIKKYSPHPEKVKKDDPEFILSNRIHAINGRISGNNQGLTMHVGDTVNWYLIGLGSNVDIHTVHFHGHSFKYKGAGFYRSDVYDLLPGTFRTVQMYPKDAGTWLFHCHVSEHLSLGMESTYTVLPREAYKAGSASISITVWKKRKLKSIEFNLMSQAIQVVNAKPEMGSQSSTFQVQDSYLLETCLSSIDNATIEMEWNLLT